MASAHSTGVASGPHRRGPLHQRSNSDRNVQALAPGSGGVSPLSSGSPSKASNVSRSTSGSTGKGHRRANTNSSAASSKSKSSRSYRSHGTSASVGSIPEVPPLRIQKERPLTASAIHIPPQSPAGESYASGSPNYTTSPARHFHSRSTSTASSLHRSILKKPSVTTLPPQTPEQYETVSSSWSGAFATPPPGEPMEPTLRAVAPSSQGSPSLSTVSPLDSYPISDLASSPGSFHSQPHFQGGTIFLVSDSPVDQNSISAAPSQPQDEYALEVDTEYEDPSAPAPPPSASYWRQFPAWARYFYGRRGGRASFSEPGQTAPRPSSTHSSDDGEIVIPHPPAGPYIHHNESVASVQMPQRPPTAKNDVEVRSTRTTRTARSVPWSIPHLDHRRLTHLENLDRQLILFCMGFLLPLCWFVASFLPLPHNPAVGADEEAAAAERYTSREARSMLAARFENARWWRRVNRGMSAVGTVVIIVVVVVALVSRFR